jgi:hypothetical protein
MKNLKMLMGMGAMYLFLLISTVNPVLAQTKKLPCDPSSTSRCNYGFAPFKLGYPSISKLTPSTFGKGKRLIAYNFTLSELFAIAYGAGNTVPDTRVVLNVRNPEKLKAKYCYELNTPPELADDLFVIMLQHLEYNFPEYTAHVSYINGADHVVVTDKEYGILLADRPVESSKRSKVRNDTTYGQ